VPSDQRKGLNCWLAGSILLVSIFLDQFTKFLAVKYLTFGKPIQVINGIFDLELVRNRGAAFGVGSHWSEFWQNFIFLGLSSIAIILILYFLYRNINGTKTLIVSISMILGGAIGNVYDRIFHGSVVDFILIHFKQYHWPNFNFADTLICIGVALYLLGNVYETKKVPKVE
jgi:signal peptidase II